MRSTLIITRLMASVIHASVYQQRSLVPRHVLAIQVTRGGLEPSAIAQGVLGEFSRQAWQVTSHPKSPRTTGNEAVEFSRQAWQVTSHPKSPRTTGNEAANNALKLVDNLGKKKNWDSELFCSNSLSLHFGRFKMSLSKLKFKGRVILNWKLWINISFLGYHNFAKPVKKIRASCWALATYKLQTSFSVLVQPDNHVVQKFDTRKIYQQSNEVIFSPPFLSVSPFLLLSLARRQSYAYAIGLYARPEIKSWPHVKFCAHAQCVLPRCYRRVTCE